ncbi:MAG: tetratricopeptide repeat protein [Cytophagales bacterium]|nr:tetratricopeptide repeat protein [Rhizobacter sp.]
MLSLPPKVISRLIEAGFVTPARGPRNSLQFSFQDVVVLRTAHQLHAAQVPPQKILRALTSLRSSLPPQMPLTGLRIAAIGGDVAVLQGDQPWEAESGQLLFAFDVAPSGAAIEFLDRKREPATESSFAAAATPWFAMAVALEGHDIANAEKAYRQALQSESDELAACINLGALLCGEGRCHEAVQLLSAAAERFPAEPLLHFNLAIALEDQQRLEEALDSYGRCLALAPDLADGHFNMARLHDKLGQPHQALRHYSAYRRSLKA